MTKDQPMFQALAEYWGVSVDADSIQCGEECGWPKEYLTFQAGWQAAMAMMAIQNPQTTLCWRCSHPYSLSAPECPRCMATNPNTNLPKATWEMEGSPRCDICGRPPICSEDPDWDSLCDPREPCEPPNDPMGPYIGRVERT